MGHMVNPMKGQDCDTKQAPAKTKDTGRAEGEAEVTGDTTQDSTSALYFRGHWREVFHSFSILSEIKSFVAIQ